MPFLERALASIAAQQYPYKRICLVDDASTDPSQRTLLEKYAAQHNWVALFQSRNLGAARNVLAGYAALECADEDVCLVVDGDDWLFHDRVLDRLAFLYRREDIWLTYGQYIADQTGEIGTTRWPSPSTIEKQRYRKRAWLYSQLRTYKYFLWRQIPFTEFQSEEGSYFGAGWDCAAMFAMLELAGSHFLHIPEILYVYNDQNPLSDFRVRRAKQRQASDEIRKRKPLAHRLSSQDLMAWEALKKARNGSIISGSVGENLKKKR